MLPRKEVMNCTDLDLLTVLIGNRQKATKIFAKAKFSLFTLLHSQPNENGDLYCAEGSSASAMRISVVAVEQPRSNTCVPGSQKARAISAIMRCCST